MLNLLRSPGDGELLTLYTFESRGLGRDDKEENIIEGILLARNPYRAYPIVSGVPIMLESSFSHEFLARHANAIARDETLSKLSLRPHDNSGWSFSAEWEQHFNADLSKTWGWTVEQRVQQFFLETQTSPDWCKGKLILDAGCGNGQLSESLSELGAIVIALDYSTSVFSAERRRRSSSVHFAQGDLQTPPFVPGTFDLIVSNGVLHHTPDTAQAFRAVGQLVKPGGRFYLWLYRRPGNFLRSYLYYPLLDLARLMTSRLSPGLQQRVVEVYAAVMMLIQKITGKYKNHSWRERITLAYDTLTPMWRHYHTPYEVSFWFFLNGFSPPMLSHWDNPNGFGMVATKVLQTDTPGVNFGKTGIVKRYWK